ncbi:MAG TPA: hypothetical protein VG034_25625 [Acidimicrobiia bacterium]|nr:hypothetical protein [Acidimicrobiia bacterium]
MKFTPEGRVEAAKAALALALALRRKDVEAVQALLGPVDPTEVALAAAGLMWELVVFVGEKLDPPKTAEEVIRAFALGCDVEVDDG